MNTSQISEYLTSKGIKPTSNRILVMKELSEVSRLVNLADLESRLYPMDKASIFRTLELFAEKEIVHVIEDGSRSLKYELCHGDSHHSTADEHVHFYCENCKETYCLTGTPVPEIDLPEGFQSRSVNYMIKGLCPGCSKR